MIMVQKKTVKKIVKKVVSPEEGQELISKKGIMAKTEIQESIKGPDPKVELNPFDNMEVVKSPATEGDLKSVQQIPASTEELVLEKNIQEPNPDEKLTPPVLLSNEELTDAYMQQSMLNQQLIEKQYIIEWKVFGQEYKGKYIYLQIDKEMFIFGTSVSDVGYIPAKDVKEAYNKFTAKD